MKNRKSLFLPFVMLLVFLLAACQPAAPEETEAPPVAPEVTEAMPAEEGACPAAANDQVVEMWSPLTGPDGDEMSALATRFSNENPYGITVSHVAQPEYIQKLNAAAAAGNLPAMTVLRVINVAELAERNVLKPMTAETLAVFGAGIADEFPANVWVGGEYEGERYSFPLDIHPLVMYYNKDLFAAAGVAEPGTTPWTRAEFESALAALHSEDVQAIAIGTAFQGATLFQSFIRQFGGDLTDEAGTTATFNSEAAVQALTYVNELKQQYSPEISGAGDPEVNVFKQGNAAIVIHGPWHISDLQKLPFVGFAPLPQVGEEYAVWAGSHQIGFTTDDPAQQAAGACWISWLSENSVEWAKAGQVPARNSVRLGTELGELAAPIAAVAPTTDSAVILAQVAELEGALWGQFGPVVDAVLMGEMEDIQAGLDAAVAQSQQIMDENAERYGE
ncbi:MAG TPA: extracellular solute-binding protein [Anaerolineales bacterium]|nr:extracellular solute-binding protein [Anaerolineales bacterium]